MIVRSSIEKEMSSFWRNLRHKLHCQLLYWQLPVQPITFFFSKWRYFCFGALCQMLQCGIHYNDVIMGVIASQITSLTIIFSTIYLNTDQRKHQSSASLAFVRGIHRRPVNSPHKWPVTRKMFPFDDVFMHRRFWSWLITNTTGSIKN